MAFLVKSQKKKLEKRWRRGKKLWGERGLDRGGGSRRKIVKVKEGNSFTFPFEMLPRGSPFISLSLSLFSTSHTDSQVTSPPPGSLQVIWHLYLSLEEMLENLQSSLYPAVSLDVALSPLCLCFLSLSLYPSFTFISCLHTTQAAHFSSMMPRARCINLSLSLSLVDMESETNFLRHCDSTVHHDRQKEKKFKLQKHDLVVAFYQINK